MRKLLISLLLASAAAATPALAGPDNSSWHSRRGDAQDERGDRGERRKSDDNQVQGQPEGRAHVRSFSGGQRDASPAQSDSGDSSASVRNWRARDRGESGNAMIEQQQQQSGGNATQGWRHRVVESGASDEGTHDSGDRRTFWRQRVKTVPTEGADSGPMTRPGTLVQPERPLPRVLQTRTPVVSNTPREGTQPPLRTERRRTSHVEWNSNWRHDRRYDWWNWRHRHRSIFHLGFYYDPFGWSYQRYSIGWRLWPSYYSRRFWISDPWYYRLPYAPPGYRWIRYYDDAVLVDTFTGEVVDVIYDFFW